MPNCFFSINNKKVTSYTCTYTCTDACANYYKYKCKSALDTCGFSCIEACKGALGISLVSPEQINCIARAKSCKSIFACVGY